MHEFDYFVSSTKRSLYKIGKDFLKLFKRALNDIKENDELSEAQKERYMGEIKYFVNEFKNDLEKEND